MILTEKSENMAVVFCLSSKFLTHLLYNSIVLNLENMALLTQHERFSVSQSNIEFLIFLKMLYIFFNYLTQFLFINISKIRESYRFEGFPQLVDFWLNKMAPTNKTYKKFMSLYRL